MPITRAAPAAAPLTWRGNLSPENSGTVHANLGELTEAELPVLDDLTRAILEYVYSAPHLATEAEARLASLKSKIGAKMKVAIKEDR